MCVKKLFYGFVQFRTFEVPAIFHGSHLKDPFDIQKSSAFSESQKKYILGISIKKKILCLFHYKRMVVYWEMKEFSENSSYRK